MSFGERLKAWRTVRKLSLVELGKRAGMSHTALSGIERGVRGANVGGARPQFESLIRALKVTPTQFYGTIPAPWSDAAQAA